MLVSRRNGTLNLVTQPDHGRLAGALAEHWGNDEFALPALREPLLYTAAYHDDGWKPLDEEPVWDPSEQRPAHFLEVPLPVVAAAYRQGVDAIYEASPIAGALESLHFTGFYRARWGMDDAPHVDHPDVPGIVEFEEDRRARAIRESWPTARARSDFERDVWHAYEILQVLDLLSLCLCLVDLDSPSTSEVEVMARTLFSIAQQSSRRAILRAPRTREGDRVDLVVTVTAPHVVEVDPFPFAERKVAVRIPSRVLEDRRYESADAAAAAFAAAAVGAREVTLVGPGTTSG
jgi:hypothetical protein